MRETCISRDYLAYRYIVNRRPFWDSCKDGFERAFAPRTKQLERIGPHRFGTADNEIEIFSPETVSNKQDWAWYVDRRIGYSSRRDQEYDPSHFEQKMYEWFCGTTSAEAKQILLVHGRTGSGKTTFVRFFFSRYLKEADKELAGNTYVCRISFPIIGFTQSRAERDFDHKIYKFLIETFQRGKHNLGNPENLIEMACLEYPNTEKQRTYFSEQRPPPDNYAAQLTWVREEVVATSRQKSSSPVSDFADFNRLAIRYLCTIDEDLRLVIILDNVDHLHARLQEQAWLLARHKLEWINAWRSVSFVITIRSYLLKNSRKENALNAYRDRVQEIGLVPPTLYDILMQRKGAFFDSLYPARELPDSSTGIGAKCSLTYKEITVPLYCPNELFTSLLNAFQERKKDDYIAKLCNFDIRQGLEIAKAIVQYPFYDWPTLAELVYEQYAKGEPAAASLVSYERILDAILRKSNIICEPKLPFFDNIYMVDNSDHFSNSLCKWYILKVLNRWTHSIEDVRRILIDLGHPRAIIDRALQELLSCNIITSPEGVSIQEHSIENLSSENTTLCRQYIQDIVVRLSYLQAMAYITPLERKFVARVPLPKYILEDNRTFRDRVKAAKVLLLQIEEDFAEQKSLIGQLDDENRRDRCNRYVAEYGLFDLVANIKTRVKTDLRNILRTEAFKHIDRKELYSWFD